MVWKKEINPDADLLNKDFVKMFRGPTRNTEFKTPPVSWFEKILRRVHIRKDPMRFINQNWRPSMMKPDFDLIKQVVEKCPDCNHDMADHYSPPGTGMDLVVYCRKEDADGNRICKCFKMT